MGAASVVCLVRPKNSLEPWKNVRTPVRTSGANGLRPTRRAGLSRILPRPANRDEVMYRLPSFDG